MHMKQTKITKEMKDSLTEFLALVNGEVDLNRIKEHPSYFMAHMIGRRPFTYQHMVFQEIMMGGKRIIICSSRQIGKSICVAVLALWCALFNKYPSGIGNNTKVCLVSKSDNQAKKLMSEIRNLIKLGDIFILKAWGKKDYVSGFIDANGVQTKEQMDFNNGCFIKSFPPTSSIRGETADMVIIDEAAFVDEEIYREDISPTTSSTNGIMVLSSTPKGQEGFFFQIFDPFEKQIEHEYKRFWFPYWICESKEQMEFIEKEKATAKKNHMLKHFQQEYEASFEVEASAFFESKKVEDCVNEDIELVYEYDGGDCVAGIDYGITQCHTVVSISTKMGGKVRLLYQYAYPFDEDYDIIADMKDLMSKFPILKIVADNGSPGVETNKAMKREGWNVECFDFRSFQHRISDGLGRNRGYYALRTAIHNGVVEFPRVPELLHELKALQEVPMKVNVAIEKPRHGLDDRADSMMMSMLPFITEDDGNFGFEAVSYSASDEMDRHPNPRIDVLQKQMKIRLKEARLWQSQRDKRS